MKDKATLFSISVEDLVKMIRRSGCKVFTEDMFQAHVDEGFPLNDDGTVDVFDYATFLIGDKLANPPPRQPPTTGFDVSSVNPTELAGWLSLYNHMGYDIKRGRMMKTFQSYHFKFQAKDNERNIDFIKFVAFLVTHRPNQTKTSSAESYEQHKSEMNRRNKEASAMGRDIGDLPEVADPERKDACRYDFKMFCETYFQNTFQLKFSDDHLRCISKIEDSVLQGGLFALALPRGSGKALALDTPILTPCGCKTMGSLKIGDKVYDEKMHECNVLFKSEVFEGHECYEFGFKNGEKIICDESHLWTMTSNFYEIIEDDVFTETSREIFRRFKDGERMFVWLEIADVRYIELTSVRKVPSVPTQCIMVDSSSHLYLAGRQGIPTHNTTMCEIAAIWSMVYGHRLFITLIGATETAALEMLDSIKIEFETNDTLAEDFPEVCFPIASLDGIANRCNGQTYHGERTRITWTSDELVLPTIAGSPASGIIVRVAGITGRVRGMKYKRPDGKAVRPELVIIDDPQTRESAKSLEQNRTRTKILAGDILGLAGPGKKIAGVMPCTIIEPDDMADTILNRDKHPEWNGEKTKLLYSFPTNMELWDKYAEIRAESLREKGNISDATQFYVENRKAMDEGAVVEWEERYDSDEVSAVQNAMNLMYRDMQAFSSEYQNEPLKDDMTEEAIMSADEIARKLDGIGRFRVPLDCTHLVMFVDVQKKCFFYTVCGFSDDFNGYVIDYGTYPEQRSRRFTLDNMKSTLQDMFSHSSVEGQLSSGLTRLLDEKVNNTVYTREDGAEMRLDRAGVDANWGTSTDVVYQVCRRQDFSGIVYPCHGHYIGAASKPMTEYKRKRGERVGLNWIIPSVSGKRASRHIVFDSNFWKSFMHSRLGVPIGDGGSLSLYGIKPTEHELFAEHLTAEYRVKTEGRGRVVDEWKMRPDRYDNHWLDCTSGCCVLASTLGCELPEHMHVSKPRKITLSEKSRSMPKFELKGLEEVSQETRTGQRKVMKLSEIARKKHL